MELYILISLGLGIINFCIFYEIFYDARQKIINEYNEAKYYFINEKDKYILSRFFLFLLLSLAPIINKVFILLRFTHYRELLSMMIDCIVYDIEKERLSE